MFTNMSMSKGFDGCGLGGGCGFDGAGCGSMMGGCGCPCGCEVCQLPPVECPADPIMDPPVERIIRRDVIHTLHHIKPENTRIINNHIFRHTCCPQYSCCEENVCCTDPCCGCNPCCSCNPCGCNPCGY